MKVVSSQDGLQLFGLDEHRVQVQIFWSICDEPLYSFDDDEIAQQVSVESMEEEFPFRF